MCSWINPRELAKLFSHKKIWSFVTDLKSLAWERLKQTVPAAVTISPESLLEKNVDRKIIKVLLMYRDQ